jgi:hypothetical protein
LIVTGSVTIDESVTKTVASAGNILGYILKAFFRAKMAQMKGRVRNEWIARPVSTVAQYIDSSFPSAAAPLYFTIVPEMMEHTPSGIIHTISCMRNIRMSFRPSKVWSTYKIF